MGFTDLSLVIRISTVLYVGTPFWGLVTYIVEPEFSHNLLPLLGFSPPALSARAAPYFAFSGTPAFLPLLELVRVCINGSIFFWLPHVDGSLPTGMLPPTLRDVSTPYSGKQRN